MAARQSFVLSEEMARNIAESGEIYTYFHPIVDIPNKRFLGFEAMAKGDFAEEGEIVRLSQLAFEGCDPELLIRVDRLRRAKALEEFKILHERQDSLKLFLNIAAGILQFEQADFTYLLKQVEESGLPPSAIVIEGDIETVLENIPVEIEVFYKECGFKTCINGVNQDAPFMDCMLRYEPTFIKITEDFLPGGPRDSYRTKMLSSLLDCARKSGTTVLGTSVASLDQAVRFLDSGLNVQQGDLFTIPKSGDKAASVRQLFDMVEKAYEQHRLGQKKAKAKLKRGYGLRMNFSSSLASKMTKVPSDTYTQVLVENLSLGGEACMGYVINEKGRQITQAIFNMQLVGEQGVPTEGVPINNSDHAMNEMFLHLQAGVEPYVSQSYYSRLADRQCFLVARTFYSRIGLWHALVLEMTFPG